MVKNAPVFCVTNCDISVVYGHAMPCAPTFRLHGGTLNSIVVLTKFRFAGKSVPVPGGGPPALCE
jgi:hypothetical protein